MAGQLNLIHLPKVCLNTHPRQPAESTPRGARIQGRQGVSPPHLPRQRPSSTISPMAAQIALRISPAAHAASPLAKQPVLHPGAAAARLPAARGRRHSAALLPAAAAASSSPQGTAAAAADVTGPLAVLRKAATTKQMPPEQVVSAIKAVEAAHKQQLREGGLVEGFPEALTGTWRLVSWQGCRPRPPECDCLAQ